MTKKKLQLHEVRTCSLDRATDRYYPTEFPYVVRGLLRAISVPFKPSENYRETALKWLSDRKKTVFRKVHSDGINAISRTSNSGKARIFYIICFNFSSTIGIGEFR